MTMAHEKRRVLSNITGMIIALFLVVTALFLSPETVYAADEVASGTCGDNLTWVLDDEGTLSISGSGYMDNYAVSQWSPNPEEIVTTAPWDSYKKTITNIQIESGVKGIGDKAFLGYSGLTNLVLPEGVESIGKESFAGCSNLTSVTLPESLTNLGEYAFNACGLKSVYIKDLSKYLSISFGDGAYILNGADLYINNSIATEITIPSNITSIKSFALMGCTSLTNIIIPNTVTAIEDNALSSCIGLTKLDVPDSVTSIGVNAFYGCTNLRTINIPDSVTSIDRQAFAGCRSLTNITIPNSVKSIKSRTFTGCDRLESITIPDGVTDIEEDAFYDCNNLSSVYTFPGTCASTYFPSSKVKYLYEDESVAPQKYIGFTTDRICIIPNSTVSLLDYLRTNIDLSECEVAISEEDVFFYDDGTIAALDAGEGNLTISSGDQSATIKLLSSSDVVNTTGIILDEAPVTIEKGNSKMLSFSLSPNNATDNLVEWSSEDESIASVDNGYVTAKGAGTTTLTVSLASNPSIKDTCEVTVIAPLKAIITTEYYAPYTLQNGTSQEIDYLLYPYDASNVNLIFASSNPDVISIDNNGVLTAHDNGTVQITLSSGEIVKTVDVSSYTPLSGLSLDQSNVKASCGDTIQLTPLYEPENTTERDVIWTSSKDSVASVDNDGLVTVHSKGIASITAKVGDYSATCSIVCNSHNWGEGTTTTEATCTDDGVKTYTCVCGESSTEVIPAKGHVWNDEYTIDKEASCKEEGSKSIHCSVCDTIDDSTVTVIPKADHTYGDWTTTKEPTCTEAGSKERVCSVCGDVETATVDATGHAYGAPVYEWAADYSSVTATRMCINDPAHKETETAGTSYAVVTEATETTAGLGRYTSDVFENEAFEVQTSDVELPPTGYEVTYEWKETAGGYTVTGTAVPYAQGAATITETVEAAYSVTTAATCTEKGVGTWTSAAFENRQFAVQTKEVEINELGHDYEAIVTVPTCTEAGYTTHTCTRCGDTYTDTSIDALGHDYQTVEGTAAAATCTEDGREADQKCDRCGDVITGGVIPATGHDWAEEYTVDREPTCTETGEKSLRCKTCSEKKPDSAVSVDALGHEWSEEYTVDKEPTCTDDGEKSIHCVRCDEKLPGSEEAVSAKGHSFGDWVVVQPATYEDSGSEEHTCTECGYKEQREIPVLVRKSISTATVTGISAKTYTGKAQTQTPTITLDGVKLVKGTDYTLSFSNNTNAGTATMVIQGKGDYTGKITKTFKINPVALSSATLKYSALTYNGKARTQTDGTVVKAKVNGTTKTLKKGTDYTITYKNNKNVGKATMTIKGKGNYTGTLTKTFKINPKGATIKAPTAASKALTAKWTKQTAKMSSYRITGYQVQVATNKSFTSNKKTVTVKGYNNASKKITGLKGGKKYYVRIRTYRTIGSGTSKGTYYSPWSAVKTVTTKK